MSRNLRRQINARIDAFKDEIGDERERWAAARTPVAFRNAEQEIARRCRDLQDEITATVLKDIVADTAFQVETAVAVREAKRL